MGEGPSPIGYTLGVQGLFITFEGPEGGGKSTQVALLADALRGEGHPVLVSREPGGGGEFGERVRRILLEGGEVEPLAELFLFLADRAQHVATVIRPAIEAGMIVICDRYADSTAVYQGIARGLGLERTRELNAMATGGLVPDVTFLLDLPVTEGLARIPEGDRLDRESVQFHEAVRQGFLQIADGNMRFHVLDARCAPTQLARDIQQILAPMLFVKGYNTPSEDA